MSIKLLNDLEMQGFCRALVYRCLGDVKLKSECSMINRGYWLPGAGGPSTKSLNK